MIELSRVLPDRSRFASVLFAVALLGLLVSVPGIAAADAGDLNNGDNANETAGSPVSADDTEHQRGEHHDGGQSADHIIVGFANACTTPANESPEGEFWCGKGA